MSNRKRRAWPGVLVSLFLLAGFLVPAIMPAYGAPALAQAPPAPDLVVESISWSPEVPVIGNEVTFTVTVRNQGESPAASCLMADYIDELRQASSQIDSLLPSAAAVKTFTWKARAGSHIVKAVIDCDDSVAEADEDNNNSTYAFSVLAPDLVIESISWSPDSPSVGSNVTFTVKVKNRGNQMAGSSFVEFYIDGNSRGPRNIPRVETGASVNETYTWMAVSGSHDIKATADSLSQVTESDETNNDLKVTYTTAAPDFIIASIGWTPENPTENTKVTFAVTVKNQGTGKSESSDVTWYIDDEIGGSAFLGPLNPGSSTDVTFEWTAGGRTHRFKAAVDIHNWIKESDETNNTRTAAFPIMAPDLIVQDITWSPTTPLISHSVTFTVTVKNQGQAPSGFTLLYLYVDGGYACNTGVPGLAAGATENSTFSWTPSAASHAVKAVIDPDNYIDESRENNNTMTKTVTAIPLSPTADLVIQNMTFTPAHPAIGDTVTITVNIKNAGTGWANPSHTAYYVDKTLLDSVYVDNISAGGSATSTIKWSAAAGAHTIKAVLDCDQGVFETDEANNEMTVKISTSAPDLTIQDIRWLPLIPSAGDEITFTITITNRGDLKSGICNLTYYVDGVSRGSHYVEELAPSANVTRTFTWKAPAESLVFRAAIDETNAVAESDKTNNERTVALPAPDLAIGGITWSPASPTENSTMTFTVTVMNQGKGPANNPYLSYYMDGVFKSRALISHINAGSTAAGVFNWTARTGEHNFKVVADAENSIAETDESNNEKTITISDAAAPAAQAKATGPVVQPSPAAAAPKQPEKATPASIEKKEPPPSNDTKAVQDKGAGQDIAKNIAASPSAGSSPWWKKIIGNRLLIFGIAGLGLGSIIFLMLLRRRARKA